MRHTPQKINMEPENASLEKENHLPNHHFQVYMFEFDMTPRSHRRCFFVKHAVNIKNFVFFTERHENKDITNAVVIRVV